MRKLLFIGLFLLARAATAQHCPWDCSGMILLKTDITPAEFIQLHPVLADKNKKPVVDTLYGTGLDTRDSCLFLAYADFVQYRTQKIKMHHWYAFDTVYHFAEGLYLVKYNYCRYSREDNHALYIRYSHPADDMYHYIEIPLDRRIHLHDFNQQIRNGLGLAGIPALRGLVMEVDRKGWNLPRQ